jgi:GT2 family glycosyltransferase
MSTSIYKETRNYPRALAAQKSKNSVASANQIFDSGLSILVLNKNKPELISQVIHGFEELQRSSNRSFPVELIIGDTGSTDPRVEQLYSKVNSGITVIRDLEYNFSKNNNDLVSISNFDTLLFMNNDVLISENTESIIASFSAQRSLGTKTIISVRLHFPDGTIQHEGVDFSKNKDSFMQPFHPNHGEKEHANFPKGVTIEVPAVTGAFLLINRIHFNHIGSFSTAFLAECQDIALCLESAKHGGKSYVLNCGMLVHIENGTRPKNESNSKDRQLFLRKYRSFCEALN